MNFSDNFRSYRSNELVIDDFDYQTNADIQAVYVEASDGGNPTTSAQTANPTCHPGIHGGVFPSSFSSGTATWVGTLPSTIDCSEFTGVSSGTPTAGIIKLLDGVSSTSQITAFSMRIGSDSSNYATWTPFFPTATNRTFATSANLSGLIITGTPNWKAVNYVYITATIASGTPNLFLSGLRLMKSTKVTNSVWYEDAATVSSTENLPYLTYRRSEDYTLMPPEAAAATGARIFRTTASFGNYWTLLAKLKWQGVLGEAGVCFNVTDADPTSLDMYAVYFDEDTDVINFDKFVNGTATNLATAAYTVTNTSTYWIKVENNNGTFSIYYSTDGLTFTKALQKNDTTCTSGYAGLYSRNVNIGAEFYEFHIFSRPYLIYDTYGLGSKGHLKISNVLEDSSPIISLKESTLSTANKDIYIRKNFKSKLINARGYISTPDSGELKRNIDDFKENLSRESKLLRYYKETETPGVFDSRVYTANCVDLNESLKREPWHRTYMPWNVTFQAHDGTGYNPSLLSFPRKNWTTYTFDEYYNFKGSAAPLPTLTFDLTDATPASGNINQIQVYNNTTSKTLLLNSSANFANGDDVVFDFSTQTITLNGSAQNYTGIMDDTFFAPGMNKITYTIMGTSNINQQQTQGVDYYTVNYLAQSFVPSATTTFPSVDMYLTKYGSTNRQFTIEIQTDNAGSPSGTPATAGATVTTVGTEIPQLPTKSWISYNFGTAASLTSGTTYWIVMKVNPLSIGATYYAMFQGTNPYASGVMKSSLDTGTSWTTPNSNYDLAFKAYAAGATAISGTLDVQYKARYL